MAQTVVIVDDHAGFRAGASALLREEGFDVIGEAADGASGLAVVNETNPDVVLLDIQLPDLTGFEVADLLTREAPTTRIVLISSRVAADYRDRLAATGAPFITKSELSGDTLVAALKATA